MMEGTLRFDVLARKKTRSLKSQIHSKIDRSYQLSRLIPVNSDSSAEGMARHKVVFSNGNTDRSPIRQGFEHDTFERCAAH